MRRSAVQIDVAAIGQRPYDGHIETQVAKQPGRHGSGCAVGRIDGDLQVPQTARIRQGKEGVLDVRLDNVGAGRRRRGRAIDAPTLVGNDRLDFAFERLGELLAPPGKDLDAVVFERIVRRRYDNPGIEVHLTGHVGHRRCGDDAAARQHAAGRTDAARQLLLDPLAGFPGITPDDEVNRTAGAVSPAPRLRLRTGTPLSSRSPGAGTIWTRTFAFKSCVRRTTESDTPIVTSSSSA